MNRKTYQHRINKLMRTINKNIERDELWRGRFIVRQQEAQWVRCDSGFYDLWVVLQFTDRLTGQTWEKSGTVNDWAFYNGYTLWWTINNFIVDICDVWRKDPMPGSKEYCALITEFKIKNEKIQWPY